MTYSAKWPGPGTVLSPESAVEFFCNTAPQSSPW
jgi:hypothetical protein